MYEYSHYSPFLPTTHTHIPLSVKEGLEKNFSQTVCISESGGIAELVGKGPVAKGGREILKAGLRILVRY